MWFFNLLPRTGLLVLILSCALFSTSSHALSCKRASDGSVEQTVQLDRPISVSTANLTAGTVLWRSPIFTSSFKCADTNGNPQGEDAYLWWDSVNQLSTIHESLEVGVTFDGVDIDPSKNKKTRVGPGTVCAPGPNGECTSPATPLTISISYSIYIKATGKNPPASGTINNQGRYATFQIDGEKGLNVDENSNFKVYVSGLGNIKFISCKPNIAISSNNGETVKFGSIPMRNAKVGKIEKSVPFIVRVDLTGPGQSCDNQALVASFSSTYPIEGNQIILPEKNSGFGILLSHKGSDWISMNTPINLSSVNGSISETEFVASLKWLSETPKVGRFNASANIDVTFK